MILMLEKIEFFIIINNTNPVGQNIYFKLCSRISKNRVVTRVKLLTSLI